MSCADAPGNEIHKSGYRFRDCVYWGAGRVCRAAPEL